MLLIKLKNDKMVCELAPEMGGAIYSFSALTENGLQPLMRPTFGEDAYKIVDFSSWPLVPFSNRIKHGKFSFNGEKYRVPITWLGPPGHASHGHGWERPWEITSQSATHCDLAFSFADKVIWPFPYSAQQQFKLDDKGLHLRLSLTNTGDKPMPAGVGIHPYFPRTDGTTLQAKVEHLWEIDEETIPSHRIAVPPHYDFEKAKSVDNTRLDHCFDGYGGTMEITWPNQPYKLRTTSSQNLKHFVVYTPEGENFFCAEPISHMPDAINRMDKMDTGLVVLNPGETVVAEYLFEAIPIRNDASLKQSPRAGVAPKA